MEKFSVIIALALVACLSLAASSGSDNVEGQTPIDTLSAKWPISSGGNDHIYKAILLPNAITWDEANAAAKLEGGYLATITSAAENEFIFNLVSNDKRYWHYEQWGNTGPWMGGYRKSSDEWGWVTGEPFTYSNWFPGEPNNWGGVNDKIAFFERGHETSSKWDDVSSTSAAENLGLFWKLNSYIVEFDTPTIIKPSTLENVNTSRSNIYQEGRDGADTAYMYINDSALSFRNESRTAQDVPRQSDQIIEQSYPIDVQCTSQGEICEPAFSVSIDTRSILQVKYIVPNHCSPLRLYIYVDGVLVKDTGLLGWPGATGEFSSLPLDTGFIDLGPVSSGRHTLALKAEGRSGGCNNGYLMAWEGTLIVRTSSGSDNTIRDKIVVLDTCSLPSTQGWKYWALGDNYPEENVFSIRGSSPNCILHQDTMAVGSANQGSNVYELFDKVDPSKPFVLKVKARILDESETVSSGPNHFGFGFGVDTPSDGFSIGLGKKAIQGPNNDIIDNTIDNTQWHEYKLAGTPGEGYEFYVDGSLVALGKPITSESMGYSGNRIYLGDCTGGTNAIAEIASFEFTQSVNQPVDVT